ncbi:MAG TPA: VOC family protein [Usitatibacter sp.]|jgi:hypothetical protein|nr:VOC family protein [Usitatibacter sp.]
MNPVVHFEMPYDEADRMATFYESAFGWKMKTMGEEMGRYVLATTTPSGPDGRPKEPGAINGGFFPRKPDWPAQHPSVVISVRDLVDAMDRVWKAGGRVLGDPMQIPGVGGYVAFEDSEGNRVSMLQPLAMPKASATKRPAKKPVAAKAKKKVAAKKPATKRRPAARTKTKTKAKARR